MRSEIVALDQQDFQSEQRGLARYRTAIDAAADDEQVVCHRCHLASLSSPRKRGPISGGTSMGHPLSRG